MLNTLSINSNSIIDDILNTWPTRLGERWGQYDIRCASPWTEDKEGNYKLTLEAPGIGKENAKFTIKNSTLRFEGDHEDYKYDQKYSIPKEADVSKCKVVLKNGIAKVTLAKLESQKPRQIDID